jgi:hypothetical protein
MSTLLLEIHDWISNNFVFGIEKKLLKRKKFAYLVFNLIKDCIKITSKTQTIQYEQTFLNSSNFFSLQNT